MELVDNKWYSSWFNTPYYHILYKERGAEEAQNFMQNLIDYLRLPEGASILDLACGKGRHSVYLNKLGYRVTGVDLSENSIRYASQFENDNLRFFTHCMCKPVGMKFDAVFNLFTSLGYFEKEEENLQSICSIKEELKPGGYGVIDFMNVNKVAQDLIPSEVKTAGGISFKIERMIHQGYVLKKICFEDQGKAYQYTEQVKALTLECFQSYFSKAGLRLVDTFGNYHLERFDQEHSERLILIVQ